MIKSAWIIWLILTVACSGWLYYALPNADSNSASTAFLPGETTHGHYQIEMKCAVCHSPENGVTDAACIDCHAAELKLARDTHPKSKFNDPTKAGLLEKIDATNCITCHVEHEPHRTRAMGVTQPADYCFHCHEDVSEDRPSHADFAFDTCLTAGCHNYHDNTALYENFLKTHYGEAKHLDQQQVPQRKLHEWLQNNAPTQVPSAQAPAKVLKDAADISHSWATSSHAFKDVNCDACHTQADPSATDMASWNNNPTHASCEKCHTDEFESFQQGRHGMRLAVGLEPMQPHLARLPMHADAAHRNLNCSTCHDPHSVDTRAASWSACVQCHDDEHTRNYEQSAHFRLWQDELSGAGEPNTGVSCATCHMPRDEDGRVNHNQNANLRPNEKMARSVCMQCHGLQYTLDALADPALKANCYSTAPSSSIRSLEMVQEWFESRQRLRRKRK